MSISNVVYLSGAECKLCKQSFTEASKYMLATYIGKSRRVIWEKQIDYPKLVCVSAIKDWFASEPVAAINKWLNDSSNYIDIERYAAMRNSAGDSWGWANWPKAWMGHSVSRGHYFRESAIQYLSTREIERQRDRFVTEVKDGKAVVVGYDDGEQFRFDCPWCFKKHLHGTGSTSYSSRTSHCLSKFAPSSYYVKGVN